MVPEPSDQERSEWPDATRAYVEELEAIVDKLPKYADTGGAIVPGMDDVWLAGPHWMGDDPVCDDGPVSALLVSWWSDHAAVQLEDAIDCDYWDGPMYSTEEAARAALPKPETLKETKQ